MLLATSQWLALIEETDTDNVDWPAVILALMCTSDPRLDDYDHSEILDTMNRDTVFAHVTELYRKYAPTA